MVEVTSVKCSVCGLEFTGKDCVEKAKKHEEIPVELPKFKIGERIVLINPLGRIELINIVNQSISFKHMIAYNGYDLDGCKVFSLHTDEDGIVYENDILNASIFEDLRQAMLEVKLKTLFKKIDQSDSISLE